MQRCRRVARRSRPGWSRPGEGGLGFAGLGRAPPGWVRGTARLSSPNPPPPPGWIRGAAAAASQGSPQLPHRRKGGETAERAKKSLPTTLIARKSLHRRSGTTGKTSIRQHRRTPGCGGAGVQHGARATESAAATSQGSPQLPHRKKGGETAERAKKSLPTTLIARKSLLRGGWRGRPRSGASTTRNAWRTAHGAWRTADGGQRGTHCARHTAHNAQPIPRKAPDRPGRGPSAEEQLALEVGELLQHLVGGGDDAGVGLETALGDDQVGELLREIDVRHLESAGLQ